MCSSYSLKEFSLSLIFRVCLFSHSMTNINFGSISLTISNLIWHLHIWVYEYMCICAYVHMRVRVHTYNFPNCYASESLALKGTQCSWTWDFRGNVEQHSGWTQASFKCNVLWLVILVYSFQVFFEMNVCTGNKTSTCYIIP